MIEYATGNLLEANAEALVNTVNTVGVMGKGIALQFKQAWPENFKSYAKACKAGEVVPGKMFIYELKETTSPHFIINFPTKRHWKQKSHIQDIKIGLETLIDEIKQRGIQSIALPPLGCGNGGLSWSEVRPLIEQAFATIPEVQVLLYAPSGTPDARTMPIGTEKPNMTEARALFIKLIERYSSLHYRLTLLEIQKLAYFLQIAGQPLRLNYKAFHYGPYAHNLNKVLEILEGHYIRGYGDSQKPDATIELLPNAVLEADKFLEKKSQSIERLHSVSKLIEGFETPYGMELLATIHWLNDQQNACEIQQVITGIQSWNIRKAQLMKPRHIEKAWNRLLEQGWVDIKGECNNISTSTN
ncbi:TPA: macro domain-containing protein [Legionella pneumophila]|nr:macro domain-containing protein [Legionella pneumophila]HAU1874389.1 macro domain-containing protein [Legionella pneumophila]HBD7079388.1 macro domain-containing protein [Legionella pneumophila]HCC0692342.1 macro domain-containing protein [Legionella pneumophila]